MKLFLVRHGETKGNVAGSLQGGGSDAPLTAKGEEQVRYVGRELRGVPFDLIYSSPKKRAQHTTEAIMAQNNYLSPAMKVTQQLTEMNFGQFEGELIKKFLEDKSYEYFLSDEQAESIGGESFEQVQQRSLSVVEEAFKTGADNVLMVSHGITIMCLVKALLIGQKIPEEFVENASLTVFDIQENHVNLLLYNKYE